MIVVNNSNNVELSEIGEVLVFNLKIPGVSYWHRNWLVGPV